MKRYQVYQNSQFIDTYASNWFVGIVPEDRVPMAIASGRQLIEINPGMAVFLPPFSIVEWKILKPCCEWYVYMGDFDLPITFGNK
jgi:hypothetical protein